jgi:predicted dehydrogenase
MKMFGFGIVGTGLIAGVIANAIEKAKNARLVAVSSRKLETAKNFAAAFNGAAAVQGFEALLGLEGVDGVYVATPTAAKEEIALAAIAAGKHVLVEKPFLDQHSVVRMTQAAAAKGVVFMDATHFVHHPRTAIVASRLGEPRSLHTTFYFPHTDRSNIRFDRVLEPMGAIGDMAWYSMRAVVEYLRPKGKVTKVQTVAERDAVTGAVIRASGVIGFESGEVSTFDAGFTSGTVVQDLQLLGTDGVVWVDDFVVDWTDSASFQNPEIKMGYWYRTGVATRKDLVFVETPADTAAQVAMMENFVKLAESGDVAARTAFAETSVKTQELVDTIWKAAGN